MISGGRGSAPAGGCGRPSGDFLRNPTVACCSARMGLAAVEYHRGSLVAAECLYTDVRSEAHALRQPHLVAMIDQNLGAMANIRGDVDAAIHRYEAALAHFESIGDAFATAGVLTNLGMAYVDVSEWSAAERCFDRALALSERAGPRLRGVLAEAGLHITVDTPITIPKTVRNERSLLAQIACRAISASAVQTNRGRVATGAANRQLKHIRRRHHRAGTGRRSAARACRRRRSDRDGSAPR